MKACASVNAVEVSGAGVESPAVVFVDGVPEERLLARWYQTAGPLDRRVAQVGGGFKADRALFLERLSKAAVTLAVPSRLVDGQVRWVVLVHGQVLSGNAELSDSRDGCVYEFVDSWNRLLDQKLPAIWWQGSSGLVHDADRSAVLRVGARGNRSTGVWSIGDELVHVLQENGQQWTVSTALAVVNAFAGLGLFLGMIPHEIGRLMLSDSVDLRGSVGQALLRILEPHGLIVQRDITRESNRVIERRAVRPEGSGRVIRLGWAGGDHTWGQVVGVDADHRAKRSRQWVARDEGWRVESTFELVHGWDPSLEGQADSTYSKADNPQFNTYANVYRLWVLNEDGRFSGEPYNQGPAFDLETLFGQAVAPAQPLRFLSNLTLDDTGSGKQPIVEASTDNGMNWKVYPGLVEVRADRAAVYLRDTVLDTEFLSAAQAGQARVRVTASLQSPEPVQVARWSGNPFAGEQPAEVLDAGEAFSFRRVASQSIHYAGVVNGTLDAEQADDTNAMDHWLINQMLLADVAGGGQRRVGVTLIGSWPWLRVGDRLINASGAGVDGMGRAEAVGGGGGRVRSVRCTWSEGRVSSGRGQGRLSGCVPVTEVELAHE